MNNYNRRQFLGRVGSGMLASAVGVVAAGELDLLGFLAAGEADALNFGELEPLVSLMQETSADDLMPKLKAELDRGTELRTLIAAGALANARIFGGQDYVGYHCFMAMVPALAMSARLPGNEAAVPVFKVMYRNAQRIQASGGRSREVLHALPPAPSTEGDATARLLAAGRNGEFDAAEAALARATARGPGAAFDSLQPLIRDNIDVHQVVLAYRSWDMMRLAGEQNASVLLRQTMRQCVDRDENRRTRGLPAPSIRGLLPQLMEENGLDRDTPAARRLTAQKLDELAQIVFTSERDAAARHVAAQLAAGVSRDDIGEALSLAAVRLLLHDPGRSRGSEGKPKGSVHGASVGLHAADSANAWRGIAAVSGAANANASLVTASWHAAGQSGRMDSSSPYHAGARNAAAAVAPAQLLGAMQEAVRGGDQRLSCALTERYLESGLEVDELIAILIEPAVEFDGALHHEKYFHTATEEYARSRPDFRSAHLIALTRVMASGYGFEAQGVELSRTVLGV